MDRAHINDKEAAYHILITYEAEYEHLVALKDDMQKCRQYIKWECRSAVINNPNKIGVSNTFWTNNFGQEMHYFGGANEATAITGMVCACGMDNSCVNASTKCNCDANDNDLREDSGYLNIKEDLPIEEVVTGDTGNYKFIYSNIQCER